MAAKNRIEQIRGKLEKLGRDSVDVAGNANRVVLQGIQKLAEQELKALNDYYKSTVSSLKGVRKGDSIKDVATKQIDRLSRAQSVAAGRAHQSSGPGHAARTGIRAHLVQRRHDSGFS